MNIKRCKHVGRDINPCCGLMTKSKRTEHDVILEWNELQSKIL